MAREDHLAVDTRCRRIVRSRCNSSQRMRNLLLPVSCLRWLVTVTATTHGYCRILRASRRVVDHDRFVARAVIVSTFIGQGMMIVILEVTVGLGCRQPSTYKT